MAEMSKYPLSDEQKAGILEDALSDARKLDARSLQANVVTLNSAVPRSGLTYGSTDRQQHVEHVLVIRRPSRMNDPNVRKAMTMKLGFALNVLQAITRHWTAA